MKTNHCIAFIYNLTSDNELKPMFCSNMQIKSVLKTLTGMQTTKNRSLNMVQKYLKTLFNNIYVGYAEIFFCPNNNVQIAKIPDHFHKLLCKCSYIESTNYKRQSDTTGVFPALEIEDAL